MEPIHGSGFSRASMQEKSASAMANAIAAASATSVLVAVFIEQRTRLTHIARKIVGSAEIAEEITQEAYLKLMQGSCATVVDRPFCYCCQIVRNLALDHCRRQTLESTYRVHTEDGELPQVAGVGTPDQSLHEHCVFEAIEDALAALPLRTRHAFELHRVSGLTQREVARELGCSATLVNFMLKDAMAALAACRDLLAPA